MIGLQLLTSKHNLHLTHIITLLSLPRCFQEDAQLLSVNNFGEEDILCQEKALNLFGNESVLTSGISFK